jgi:hypothetical protein
MPRITRLFAAALLAVSSFLVAQDIPPKERGFVNGITISDIPNAPFSATAVIELERYFPDGSTLVRRTINLIARDSSGRTRNETRRLMPEYFHGSPELMGVRLFDPLTRIRTIYDPAQRIARQQVIPQRPETSSIVGSGVNIEDLGASTLDGLQTKGTRRTYTVSAKTSGTGGPVVVEDEDWYSQDLHISLLTRHYDPRFGIVTVGVSGLKREEPAASMFKVPPGYRILDVNPPGAGTPAEPKP